MKVLIINPPFRYKKNEWITVPPQGYGGIQWIIKNLVDGLIEYKIDVLLMGAPGSKSNSNHLKILDIAKSTDINQYLREYGKNLIVSDHSCRGIEFGDDIRFDNCPNILHSHYLISKPRFTNNIVAASHAHAVAIGYPNCPVIRHSVNPKNYIYSEQKEDYLLFMGRISYWKGTHVAAEFAKKARMKLKIVGPSWERDYFDFIKRKYGEIIDYYGEAGGKEKKEILSKARATLVFSGGVHIPTGLKWIEPGSQIVSESGISGTPVISSSNGCLKEIVPYIGTVVNNVEQLSNKDVDRILNNLPSCNKVYEYTDKEWNYKKIAMQYIELFERVKNQQIW